MTEKKRTPARDQILKQLFPGRPDTLEAVSSELIWREQPPDFHTFVTSREFLGQMPLSRRQRRAIDKIFGDDPTKIFSDRDLPLESILAWGKGSGKDILCSYIIAYITFVVLCLEDPHSYFGLAQGENMDILNIASNAAQAKTAFFTKLKSRIRRPCFARFGPKIAGELIEFSQINLNLHSKHAENESWEGLNILAWVMDEASAFRTKGGKDNADACYSTLRTSANTRFMAYRWIGVVISFPRKQVGDFTLDLWKKAQDNPRMFADRAATWEVNPNWDPDHPLYKDIPWVTIEDLNVRVPEVFKDDFERDPTDARTKLMADPPPTEGGFFEIPSKIVDAVNPDLPGAIYTWGVTERHISLPDGTTTTRKFVRVDIDSIPEADRSARYFLHGDPGLVNDAFAIAVCHTTPITKWVVDEDGNEREFRKVILDLVIYWEPRPNTPVDLLNVDETLVMLCRYYGIKKVTFDRWNSANSIQKLNQLGILAEDMSFSAAQQYNMYRNLKLHYYSNFIETPDDERLRNELTYLKNNNGKIDHDVFGKDCADAVAAAVWEATGKKQSRVSQLVEETLGMYDSYNPQRSFELVRSRIY